VLVSLNEKDGKNSCNEATQTHAGNQNQSWYFEIPSHEPKTDYSGILKEENEEENGDHAQGSPFDFVDLCHQS
jgi:hypothetical protein